MYIGATLGNNGNGNKFCFYLMMGTKGSRFNYK